MQACQGISSHRNIDSTYRFRRCPCSKSSDDWLADRGRRWDWLLVDEGEDGGCEECDELIWECVWTVGGTGEGREPCQFTAGLYTNFDA